MNINRIMEDARDEFLIRAPYYASILYSLAPYETLELPTCAVTEGMTLLFNPEYFEKLYRMQNGVVKVATRLWHEVGHVTRDYFAESDGQYCRLPGVDKDRRNIVSDLAINSSGLPGGWDFGPDGLLPAKYGLPDGLTMEEYHNLLPLIHTKIENKCGSGAGNPVGNGLDEKVDQKYGRSKVEIEGIMSQTAQDIKRFAQGSQAGKLPAGLTEWANALLKPPVVPWTQTFSRTVRYCTGAIVAGGGLDSSYKHPARSTWTVPNPQVLKPGEVGQELEICLCLDTSGSMSIEHHIMPALREARGAFLAAGVRSVWWLEVDAALGCAPKRIALSDLTKIEIHGRGGTDFRPGFAAAEGLRPKPDMLIYLTDGFGPAPSAPPARTVTIWLLVGQHVADPAPWGHKVYVKE